MFDGALKLMYAIKDSSKVTQRGFQDWEDTPMKGLKVLEIFTEFEKRFGRLFVQD
jgi:hypothetical protein